MKKARLLPMLILVILFFSACTNQSEMAPTKDSMVIHIKNNANFDMYGVELHIFNSTQGGVNADGSKLRQGEILSFQFNENDFPLSGETTFKIGIIKNIKESGNHDVFSINQKFPIKLGRNKEIFFEITGNSAEEAELK